MDALELTGRFDDYNLLVAPCNALVNQRNAVYERYSRLIDDVNDKVRRYNMGGW